MKSFNHSFTFIELLAYLAYNRAPVSANVRTKLPWEDIPSDTSERRRPNRQASARHRAPGEGNLHHPPPPPQARRCPAQLRLPPTPSSATATTTTSPSPPLRKSCRRSLDPGGTLLTSRRRRLRKSAAASTSASSSGPLFRRSPVLVSFLRSSTMTRPLGDSSGLLLAQAKSEVGSRDQVKRSENAAGPAPVPSHLGLASLLG
ncbi:hypothetical protein NL676_009555 [Syzygium grande]|nr:hypothetical protein NL676_009555 [Syzygium grande]